MYFLKLALTEFLDGVKWILNVYPIYRLSVGGTIPIKFHLIIIGSETLASTTTTKSQTEENSVGAFGKSIGEYLKNIAPNSLMQNW